MSKFAFIWAEENYNYYDLGGILTNYGATSKKVYGQGINNGLTFGKNFCAEFYLPENELKQEAENWYKFLTNKSKLNLLLKNIDESSIKVINQIKKLTKTNLSKLTNKELYDTYEIYDIALGRLFTHYIATQPHRIKKIENEIFSFLEKKKLSDLTHCFSVLTTPPTKIIFSKDGNKLFSGNFSELVGKEGSKIDKNLINKKFYTEKKADFSERTKLIKQLKIPKKIIHLMDIMGILGHERFKMRFVWMPAIYYNELFLMELKRRYGISKFDLRAYDFEEFYALIEKGKKISSKEIKTRKLGFLKLLVNGKLQTYKGLVAQKMMDKLIPKKQNVSELKGMSASKGIVVGKALILSYRKPQEHYKKIKSMKEGDIIVTEMTRPNILTACEKAGAIITDEGGILCHAAIVSRELKIPCIIGTKIATSSLKDGDLIEVNANIGLIKKISAQEYKDKFKKFKKIEETKISENTLDVNPMKKGNVYWFKELGIKDIPTVGGKGASLGELDKFTKIPPGFCISAWSYKQFLNESDLGNKIFGLIDKFRFKTQEDLDIISKKIRTLILKKEISEELKKDILKNYKLMKNKKVAVRSSATAEDLPGASFAGQQDTYLNINTEKDLLKSVKKCWASLYTSRAIYYREKKGFEHSKVLISVVVQEMVDAKYAGVMFTLDPLNKKNIFIEAVRGLGEQLVSGMVTPSAYTVSKTKFNILDKTEKFKMDPKLIIKIAKMGAIIEKHYKFPQDIEWAINDKNEIYIVQSRAITT
jgi:phosphohistidine swiveling domain-containing protein